MDTKHVILAARLAPFVLCGLAIAVPAGAETGACSEGLVCVSPARVAFSISPNGAWKYFGPSNERSFLEKGGVLLYARAQSGVETELVNATGGAKSLLSTPIGTVKEGARGGAREPFPRPDDDYDGKVDEDPLDRFDNDGDGRVDEDFAAIGDEMAVAVYGPKGDSGLEIRQELYAWSLPHVDAMAATAISVRAGKSALDDVRVGIFIQPAGSFESEPAPLIESDRLGASTSAGETLVWRDGGNGMALLVWAPSAGAEDWEIREDRKGTRVLSPLLGQLAAGAETTIYAALIALPPDDLRSARAIQAAWRTLAGKKGARLIPPPVSLTVKPEETAGEAELEEPAVGSPYGAVTNAQLFWSTPGKLAPSLLVGSPNPFRDAIAIDYEVPETVVDESGVEHQLSSDAVETSVKVYNVTGRLVATLVESPHAPGRYRTGWSAQDDQGATVAGGVYYVKLTIGRRSVTQRMVQLK
jgi:hypothetical protein